MAINQAATVDGVRKCEDVLKDLISEHGLDAVLQAVEGVVSLENASSGHRPKYKGAKSGIQHSIRCIDRVLNQVV